MSEYGSCSCQCIRIFSSTSLLCRALPCSCPTTRRLEWKHLNRNKLLMEKLPSVGSDKWVQPSYLQLGRVSNVIYVQEWWNICAGEVRPNTLIFTRNQWQSDKQLYMKWNTKESQISVFSILKHCNNLAAANSKLTWGYFPSNRFFCCENWTIFWVTEVPKKICMPSKRPST